MLYKKRAYEEKSASSTSNEQGNLRWISFFIDFAVKNYIV